LNSAYDQEVKPKEPHPSKSRGLSDIFFRFSKARHFFTVFTISGGMVYSPFIERHMKWSNGRMFELRLRLEGKPKERGRQNRITFDIPFVFATPVVASLFPP